MDLASGHVAALNKLQAESVRLKVTFLKVISIVLYSVISNNLLFCLKVRSVLPNNL